MFFFKLVLQSSEVFARALIKILDRKSKINRREKKYYKYERDLKKKKKFFGKKFSYLLVKRLKCIHFLKPVVKYKSLFAFEILFFLICGLGYKVLFQY